MRQFNSINKIDTAILYILQLIASISVLFLAAGLTTSVANVLTGGEVISGSEIGKQFYAWSQAIGIDSAIPGVIMTLFTYYQRRSWGRATVYSVLTILVLFTAYNVSTVESIAQTLGLSLDKAYTVGSLVSVTSLVSIRTFCVLLLIVAHALKHVQEEQTIQEPKPVKPVIVTTVDSVQSTSQAPVKLVDTSKRTRKVTPINEKEDEVRRFLDTHPDVSAREVSRQLHMSATWAAKLVKKIRAEKSA